MRSIPVWAGVVLATLSFCVQATKTEGVYFSHHDWEIACDNTGTCRAAGYQSDDDSQTVSVLLTRKAGPREPVTGKLRIGEWNLDGEVMDALRSDNRLSLHINGERVGLVEIDRGSLIADLPEGEVTALLPALQRDSTIEWVHDEYRWHLSDAGATAVLLKMDDAQGRVDTPGAIVRKGGHSEDEVPPAEPAPVVVAQPVPTSAGEPPLKAADIPTVKAAIRASTPGDDECIGLYGSGEDGEELEVARLSGAHLLVSTVCWTAAYNLGFGYWVINDAPPYEPVQVTQSGSYFEDGTISAAHKGRGLGDCWSGDEWTWDGRRFVHTSSFSMGMCRLVAAGGAWKLPTLVTEVRRGAGTP